MPVFDFKCTKCNAVVERIVKFSETDSQVCSCGAPMTKELSAPGVVIPDPNHAAGFKPRERGKYKVYK